MIAIVIVAVVYGGMFIAYTQSTRQAQWSGYSLAAQALAIQQIEQARSADWDPSKPENDFTNLNFWPGSTAFLTNPPTYTFKGYTWTNLDLPSSGGNFVRATNFVTIRVIGCNNMAGGTVPGVQLQMVRVDTVWPLTWQAALGSVTRLYTNTICTYAAPDNRDNTTL